MAKVIEDLPLAQKLASGKTHFIDVDVLPWIATAFPGVEVKVLYSDEKTGMSTVLARLAPGALIPLHEHQAVEQTYVLEGSLEDEQGVVSAGQYCWREAGNTHIARAPKGAVVLSFFLKPNRFYDGTPWYTDAKHGKRD
jgi:anti-sigma factor ChrR (cupin superfamily)